MQPNQNTVQYEQSLGPGFLEQHCVLQKLSEMLPTLVLTEKLS